MFIEMTCPCVASFQFEAEDDSNLALLWAQQFVDAHKQCGYMANTRSDKPETVKRLDFPSIKPNYRFKEYEGDIDDGGVSI
jgi:hypothetical protein